MLPFIVMHSRSSVVVARTLCNSDACLHAPHDCTGIQCSLMFAVFRITLCLAAPVRPEWFKLELRSVVRASRRGTHIHMADARSATRPCANARADRRIEALTRSRRVRVSSVQAFIPPAVTAGNPRRGARWRSTVSPASSCPAFNCHTAASVKGSSTTSSGTPRVFAERSPCGVRYAAGH